MIKQADNFFELGGDSPSVMQVVEEASRVGLHLMARDVFDHPRLQELGRRALRKFEGVESSSVGAFELLEFTGDLAALRSEIATQLHLRPAAIQDAFPCSALQKSILSLAEGQAFRHCVAVTWEPSPTLHVKRFQQAWATVLKETPVLRSRFVKHDALGLLQVMVDENTRWNHSSDAAHVGRILDTEEMKLGGPLVRHALICNGSGNPYSFVLQVHCALLDDASLHNLFHAVKQAYELGSWESGPPIQAFMRYRQTVDFVEMDNFWSQYLNGCEAIQFPTGPPTVEKPMANEAVEHCCSFTSDMADPPTAASMYAAWALVVSEMTGSHDLLFNTTVFRKDTPIDGLERMPGSTTAVVPLRITADRDQELSTYLQHVRDQLREKAPI